MFRLLLKVPHHRLLSNLDFLLICLCDVVLPADISQAFVTIHAIRYVTDPMMAKARAYNPVTAMELLLITPVSKAHPL